MDLGFVNLLPTVVQERPGWEIVTLSHRKYLYHPSVNAERVAASHNSLSCDWASVFCVGSLPPVNGGGEGGENSAQNCFLHLHPNMRMLRAR